MAKDQVKMCDVNGAFPLEMTFLLLGSENWIMVL